MDKLTMQAQKRLVDHWNKAVAALHKMRGDAQVKPEDANDTFKAAGSRKFTVKPFVVNLPERASAADCRLYVVIEGELTLADEVPKGDVLVTREFKTRVAYFRKTSQGLEHVYGAHFDFSPNHLGHPFFHCQVASMHKQREHIGERFRIDAAGEDGLARILGNVRVPTAQMDVFSLFLQICADHLLIKEADETQRRAFDDLLHASLFLRGAASQFDRLGGETARGCYRAMHWYPLATPPPSATGDKKEEKNKKKT